MRFLLDENVPRELARSLAARGHDALPLPATMRAADDATILDAAARDDRAMVTLDTDFGRWCSSTVRRRHPPSS